MKFFIHISLIISILICTISCEQEKQKLSEKEFKKKYGDTLVRVNKFLVKKDEQAIRSFAKRRGWDIQMTGTGLFYEVFKKGAGKKAEAGKNATINFTLSLLDGTVCYSSDSLGPKTFKVMEGDVESGLQEGILLMKEGDKAHFILPPYMAHGLLGDDNKIPPRSIIVYEVELIKISE